jgi:hypothetical protein
MKSYIDTIKIKERMILFHSDWLRRKGRVEYIFEALK